MGTLWIRAGQILALRSDLFSAEFCAELSKLRDQGAAVPFEVVRRIVEEELSAPLEDGFDEFEEMPIVATTMSQIHVAHLRREKVQVAVRVQHPYARLIFLHDAALIQRLARMLEFFSVYPNMRWRELCQELDELMLRELDYRYEASSVREIRKKLRKQGAYVHRIFSRYSTPRVLVTEFVTGALMSDYIRLRRTDPKRLAVWLATNNIDPKRLASRLFNSVFRQVFEDNFFHADMHPDNVILLRNSRFSILDCRDVGKLESENLERHRMFFEALADGEYSSAADLYLLLATTVPVVDVADVKARLVRIWRAWEARSHVLDLPYDERSISQILNEVNGVTFDYKFASRWSLARLARTWANLDSSLAELDPRMNCRRAMRRYFRKAERRQARAAVAATLQTGVRSLNAAGELRKRLAEYRHFRDAVFRRQAQVFQGSTTKAASLVVALLGSTGLLFLFTEVFFGMALLHQHHGVAIQPLAGGQVAEAVMALPEIAEWMWAAILVALLYLHRRVRALKRGFSETEVRVPQAPATV
jgi:ubiquinone biosynthesis protein